MNRTPLFTRLHHLYSFLVRGGTALQSPVLLAIRLYWGWHFCQTGFGKLQHLSDTTEFFASLHLFGKDSLPLPVPAVNAALAGATECFGGLLLLLGLASRLVALPLIFTMLVAYSTADFDSLSKIFSDSDKFVTASPFLFLLASVIVLAFGPGVFSLDHLLAKRWRAAVARSERPVDPPVQASA